jgi:hypothetical protein
MIGPHPRYPTHVMPSSGCDCLGPLLAVVSTGKDWEMVTEQVNRLMVNHISSIDTAIFYPRAKLSSELSKVKLKRIPIIPIRFQSDSNLQNFPIRFQS